MTREPLRRVQLPDQVHAAVDDQFKLKAFAERKKRPRFKPRAVVYDFDRAVRLIDGIREVIREATPELSDDPETITQYMLLALPRDALLSMYIREERRWTETDTEKWVTIMRTFAYRLLGRYNREVAMGGGEDD